MPKGDTTCLQGLCFVLTGTFRSLQKEEMCDLIERCGGTVKPDFQKKEPANVLCRGYNGANFKNGQTPKQEDLILMEGAKYWKARDRIAQEESQPRLDGAPPLHILDNDTDLFRLIRELSGESDPVAPTAHKKKATAIKRTILLEAHDFLELCRDDGAELERKFAGGTGETLVVMHGLHPGYCTSHCKVQEMSYDVIKEHFVAGDDAYSRSLLGQGARTATAILQRLPTWLLNVRPLIACTLIASPPSCTSRASQLLSGVTLAGGRRMRLEARAAAASPCGPTYRGRQERG